MQFRKQKRALPQEASNYMLEEANRLLFHELVDHVAQNSPDGVEALIGLAYVRETDIVQQDLLDNEDGNSLAEL
jgi:heme oxygenase